MKTINAQNLEELGKLYLKHSEQKKKLFNLSIDVTIEDFRYFDLEKKYGFSFKNQYAVDLISREIAEEKLTTLEDIEDFVAKPRTLKNLISSYLEVLQKREGIKFSKLIEEKKKAEREEAARKKKAAREEAREEAAEKQRQRDEEKRLKQKAAESAFKERIIEKHGEEIWKNYKKKKLCFDMPIELVRLMKGKEGQKKQSASKGSGTKTQLFYGKKTSKRGTVSYTLRIDFENGLCSGWTDL